jgi:hypothetical protein
VVLVAAGGPYSKAEKCFVVVLEEDTSTVYYTFKLTTTPALVCNENFCKMGGCHPFFQKKPIFDSFSCSFFSSFLKNGRKMKTENEAKMKQKWPKNGYCDSV